jgi:hypothetical protein
MRSQMTSKALESSNEVGTTSVWSSLTFSAGGAYSTVNQRAIEDCLRPKRVDCFSIQQNSWISDSLGNPVLWVQNAVELAKLDGASYYGTFTFQIWNGTTARQPVTCEPRSNSEVQCRAPFYTDQVSFPQTFTFYSHISHNDSKYELQMSNNLGAMTWEVPMSINCPCYFESDLEKSLPWGRSPFELVVVGLDSSATAVFRNDTAGRFGPVLVQSADGLWHETLLKALQCPTTTGCAGVLATAEESSNLAWNASSRRFYWFSGASDQGAFISSTSNEQVSSPPLPNPQIETYIYAQLSSFTAYLTVYDEQQRALGVDPQTGERVEQIPNSSITHNSSEDLLIVNPIGGLELVITAAGNTRYDLFVSKTTNTGNFFASQHANGTLTIGYSERLRLNSSDMKLSPETSSVAMDVLPVGGIVVALLGFVGLIAVILYIRRKHTEY